MEGISNSINYVEMRTMQINYNMLNYWKEKLQTIIDKQFN